MQLTDGRNMSMRVYWHQRQYDEYSQPWLECSPGAQVNQSCIPIPGSVQDPMPSIADTAY